MESPKRTRIVCGYCSIETTDLPEYNRRQYGNLVAMQMHLMEDHGITFRDFQEHMRREPPRGQEDGSEVYSWFLITDGTLCMWSEKV